MNNPFDVPGSTVRKIGFTKIFIAIFAAFLLIQYSLIERIIGRYLAVHNSERPLAGQAWTSGVEKELAAGRSEVPEVTNGVRGDLAQWFLRAERGRPTTLSLQRFATLWTSLPGFLSETAIENDDWQKLAMNPEADRVRPTVSKKGVELTFLTASNRPVMRINMKRGIANRLMLHNQVINDSVTKSNVEMRLIDGKSFNERFLKLQPADRKVAWSMLSVDILLHRPILRYGINALDDSYSVLWMEYQSPTITSIGYVIPNSIASTLGAGG